jgi:hypothetical protein
MPETSLSQIAWEYLKATAAYWWFLFVGVLMPLPDIWKHIHPRGAELPIPRWIRWSIGVICLSLAQFCAYKNQTENLNKVIDEKQQLSIQKDELARQLSAANNEPNFSLEINQLGAAPAPARKGVVVWIAGVIKNFGGSGIVDGFFADLNVDGNVIHGEFPVPPGPTEKVTLGRRTHGRDLVVSGADYWGRTAQVTPILHDLKAPGWLFVIFKGVTMQELYEKRAKLTLFCADMSGKKSSAGKVFGTNKEADFLFLDQIQKH